MLKRWLLFSFLVFLVGCTDAVPDIALLKQNFPAELSFENEVVVNGETHIASSSTNAFLTVNSKVSEVSIGEGITCDGFPWQAKANVYPLSLSADGGKKQVSYRVKVNGISSSCITEEVYVDTAAPTANSFNVQSSYTNGTVKFAATFSPTLGISATNATEMLISNDGTCSSGSWEAYSSVRVGWVLMPMSDGVHTASVKFRNLSGLESACLSDSITLDTTAPETTAMNPSLDNALVVTAKTQTPWINWSSAADAGSGVLKYQLSLGTSAGGTEIRDWTDVGLTGPARLVGLNLLDQVYFLNIRAVDNLMNTSGATSLPFTVQTVTPTLTLISPSLSHENSPQFEVGNIYTDYTVGLYSDSSCTNELLSVPATGTTMTINAPILFVPGTYNYYARSTSSGGVSSCMTMGVSYTYDPFFVQSSKLVDDFPRSVNAISANLGWAVAVSEDQSTLVVGAPNESTGTGAVYIYTKLAGAWTLQQKLNGTLSGDLFGYSVAISGDTVVVGAYQQDSDAADANAVTNAGAAYVYTRSGSTWTFQQKIVATGTNARMANDAFGWSVAISGNTIAIGAKGHDYDATGTNLLNDAGAVFIFTRASTIWSLQQKLVGTGTNGRIASDIFGYRVAISDDTVVIGAPGHGYDETGTGFLTFAGAAFVFTRSSNTWTLEQKLAGVGTVTRSGNDAFGSSVSIEDNMVAIGAPGQDTDNLNSNSVTDAGAAYVYQRSGGLWSLDKKITPSGTNARKVSDKFGSSVSISQGRVAIGASFHDYDSAGAASVGDSGAVWVFMKDSTDWIQRQKIVPQGTNARVAGDNFGSAVAMRGLTLIVGANLQDYDTNGTNNVSDAGAAFVFAK